MAYFSFRNGNRNNFDLSALVAYEWIEVLALFANGSGVVRVLFDPFRCAY